MLTICLRLALHSLRPARLSLLICQSFHKSPRSSLTHKQPNYFVCIIYAWQRISITLINGISYTILPRLTYGVHTNYAITGKY